MNSLIFTGTMVLISKFGKHLAFKKSQQKRISIENLQALKEKSDKFSIQNKFIATITHEIRNFVTRYSYFLNRK